MSKPRKINFNILIFVFICFYSTSYAAEVSGYLNTGIWFLKNDLDSNPNFTTLDNYGQSYVQGNFSMFNANTNLDITDINHPNSNLKIAAHLKGRFLYHLLDHKYSLAPYDRYRYQTDEVNTELGINSSHIWLGRHSVYETGGTGVDGITALFDTSSHVGLGIYGGLGNDPRSLTGYIGPTYKTALFNADFLTGGGFIKMNYKRFQMDLGLNAFLFDKKIDRTSFYTQYFWNAANAWDFWGILDIGFMGDKGLKRGMLGATTKITPRITNRFTFSQFQSYFYKRSDASGIPVPANIAPTLNVGKSVDTSAYYIVNNEVQFKIDRNYFFTSFEFARRTFDDRNRAKYSFGYFDPEIFESDFDFRIQTDIINNFVGFNTSIDTIIGHDFFDEKFRAEIGSTFYANERNLFQSGKVINSKGEIEKETALRTNLEWNTTHKLSWFLNYAYYIETDIVNNNQKVHTHDIYLSSNLRF